MVLMPSHNPLLTISFSVLIYRLAIFVLWSKFSHFTQLPHLQGLDERMSFDTLDYHDLTMMFIHIHRYFLSLTTFIFLVGPCPEILRLGHPNQYLDIGHKLTTKRRPLTKEPDPAFITN